MRRTPKQRFMEPTRNGDKDAKASSQTIADILANAQAPVSLLPPREDAPTVTLPIVPTVEKQKAKPPKLFYRRYPKELRRSRDIGLNILNQKPDPDDE